MRRLALLTAPILATTWLFACEEDPNNGALTIQLPDGGGYDANAPAYDGNVPPPDATTDVAVGPLPVTVVVANGTGTPVANVTVVFNDADGAVIETKTTDAQGKAVSGITPIPAMATVVFADANQREFLTFTGVEGGDVLPVVAPAEHTLAEVEVTLPGQYLGDGGPTTNYYANVGGCQKYSGSASEPISVALEPYCYTGSGAVLVTGTDIDDNAIAYSLKKPTAAPTDGGTFAVTTEAWTTPPTDVKVSIANVSDTNVYASLAPIANQTAFTGNEAYLGEGYEHTFKAPPGPFSDAYNASVYINFDSTVRLLGKRVAPTGSIAFDANDFPVEVTDASVDSTTADRPVASWTGNMAAMKGGVVRLWWFDSPNERTTRWSIVVPPNAAATGSVKAPALPPALSGLVPAAAAGENVWHGIPEVNFVDSDLLPDYKAWRQIQGIFFSIPVYQYGDLEQTVLPQNGTLKLTNYHPNFG